jgi:hypothetical protein
MLNSVIDALENQMGTVAETETAKGTQWFDNKRSRPANQDEVAILDAVGFPLEGKIHTLGSEETIMVELPKHIFCQHTAGKGICVRSLLDLSDAEPETLRDLIAEQVKITVSMCSGHFARNEGVTDLYVKVTAEGLKGETEERGAKFSPNKFGKLLDKKYAGEEVTDEELQYLVNNKQNWLEHKAEMEKRKNIALDF